MGNVPISCCRSKSPRPNSESRGGDTYSRSKKLSSKHGIEECDPASLQQSAQNILQHISEREPDDTDTDPSSRLYSTNQRVQNIDADDKLPIGCEDRYKASSCSTIFIDNSTISQPDLDQTIKCVSLAIYYHIRNRSSDEVSEIFDETVHPLRMPASPSEPNINDTFSRQFQQSNQTEELIILDNDNQTSATASERLAEPDHEIIYNFVRTLFKAAQLTSEYAITMLVYLERLMTYAEMDLAPKSWRRIFLGAILLSSKVWEDQAIWNVDYAQILEGITVDDINELERHFLELIQFNMNVPSSVYAKYYFHLRTLALKNGLTEQQTLMTTGKAKDLEAMSKVHLTDDWFSSPIQRKSPPTIKKHMSLEKLRTSGHSRAVLM